MRKDPHKHTDQEEPFLARWSRKKTATDDESGPVAATIPEQSPLEDELSTEPKAADIATLTDEDMPPVESLDKIAITRDLCLKASANNSGSLR